MTRVVIVDDHRVLREGLARSLTAFGIDVVGEAGDGPEGLAAVGELRPDVVLLDVSLPSMDGVEVTRHIVEDHPGIKVIILTMFGDGETHKAARRAGAAGYLVKDSSTATIAETIEAVTSGRADRLDGPGALDSPPGEADPRMEVLSRREAEVLQLIAEGASTEAVARRLYISVKTVKNHLANIYEKTDTRDRTQAIVHALRSGIIRLR